MKKNKFLSKLRKEEKIELVEPSSEICDSYLEKSKNCLTSAGLLFKNDLYENSVGMSYYAMYNSLIAFLFRVGIKSENHSGSILLLKLLFDEAELFKIISNAKEERIDKQYYVTTEKDDLTKEPTQELLADAEDFVLKIKVIISNIAGEYAENMREKFRGLLDNGKK